MARGRSVDMSELSVVCSQVKRTILNKIKKGTITKISKTEAFELLAPRLGLASSRSLWSGKRHIYLDNWYNKIQEEIEDIQKDSKSTNTSNGEITKTDTNTDTYTKSNDSISNLEEKLDEALKLIKSLEEALRVVRIENDNLREKLLDKYGKIDL